MLYITQFIFLKNGKEKEFYEFEDHVIPLMEEHKGVLEYRIRPTAESFIGTTEQRPHEVHLVSFPTEKDLSNYKNDKRRLKYTYLKEDSVQHTITTQSEST